MKLIFFIILVLSLTGVIFLNAYGEIIFSYTIGKEGTGITEFRKPIGIHIDEEKIFVAEFQNRRIQILDLDGSFESFIDLDGRPHGIGVYRDRIYVAVWAEKSHVDIFDKNGERLSKIFGFERPGDIAMDDQGNIFVTEYDTGLIKVLDTNENVVKRYDTLLAISNNHSELTGITLDSSGNIYTSDYLNNKVVKLDSSGNFLMEYIVPVEEGGTFTMPTNVEIKDDEIFVTDISNKILVFRTNGDFLYSFGESGKGDGQFSAPHGISFDESGNIYVNDYFNHRIQVFTVDDTFEKTDHETSQMDWFSELINWIRSFF